ncbi:hypothetical protein [[Flexibacter] sp. ATCC 35208]|uniref:hypothetical protein n=1 Tax=[Flexibacter] sp. ATCC 35208 TaxID=1936242 RepID=UPI00117CF8A0|nr:hypothetical protein [[Flexibacter] sp. ATCC 35208]
MKKTLTRALLRKSLAATYASVASIQASLTDPDLPDDLASWLSRLALLNGVPFNYLVPDERMLPQESIRFFYLDQNWVTTLCDGAFSIGRNLTADTSNAMLNLDAAVLPQSLQKTNEFTTKVRSKKLGTDPPPAPTIITGFLLRSSLVLDYPSLGVNAYPKGGTPDDQDPDMLDILRLEQLGPKSDTMICLISGNAWRIDIHEAPQALHYGIDCFNDNCQVKTVPVLAVKNLHTFTITTTTNPNGTKVQSVNMSDTSTPTDISNTFRSPATRVLNMKALAGTISNANNGATIDAAIMGFEMTEGIGMVSFINQ